MTPELLVLLGTAISIGIVHTLVGPDHYLPFVLMSRAEGWGLGRTLVVTALCGVGHVMSSVVLGIIGIAIQSSLVSLQYIEAVRGNWAAWGLIAFGLVYGTWGLRNALKSRKHAHWHLHHNGTVHDHTHNHHGAHAHAHRESAKSRLTPWALMVLFVLGPCEALIPLLMYPAASHSWAGVISVTVAFSTATLLTMTIVVAVMALGLRQSSFGPFEKYSNAFAGYAVAASGLAIMALGI